MARSHARFVLPLLCILTITGLEGQEERDSENKLRDAILATHSDIERAVEELNTLRTETAADCLPLAKQIESLRTEVKDLRARAERARTIRQQGEREQQALVDRNQFLAETCRFGVSLLSEYRRSLETRTGKAETAALADRLAEIDLLLREDSEFDRLPETARRLLQTASSWNKQKLGGMIVEGAAIDDAGIEHRGRFAVLGPSTYFCATDGAAAGPVIVRLGSTMPAVYGGFTEDSQQQIALLVDGRPASIPIDVTSGDALKVARAKPSLGEHVKKGGFVMIPLLAIGVLAVLLVILKLLEFGRIDVGPSPLIDAVFQALNRGDVEQASSEAGSLSEPLRSILREGIEHRDAANEHIEEILEERVLASVPRLERHLGLLAVLGGIAPLLGLLGTVTGMIHTFQLVTVFGTGDAKLLSSGISEALVTTEFGLAIAIPVLLAHALLSRRVRTLVERLESTAARLTDDLKLRKAK